jgi:hypothetical protein
MEGFVTEFFIVVLIIILALLLSYIFFALYSNRILRTIKGWYDINGAEPSDFEKHVEEYWKQRAAISPRPGEVDRTKRIKSTQLFERYSISIDTILAGERLYLENYLRSHPRVNMQAGNKREAFYIQDRLTGSIVYLGGPVAAHSGKKLLKEIIKYHKKIHSKQN